MREHSKESIEKDTDKVKTRRIRNEPEEEKKGTDHRKKGKNMLLLRYS